ncbi:MAG: antibiotic biosynthesis monooxygenase [Nitrospirae bacterium]|nr:MAG: antibiotic biosynthesis monooxygenase [Nitrospirota bacterium]
MFIAMNQFHVAAGRGAEFERRWRERDSHLEEVPGFVSFHLLRGEDEADGSHRYASHTVWADRAAFEAWTRSEAFRKAHQGAPLPKGLLLGPPRLALWEAVLP